jgi:hypothetical protein
MWVLWKSDNLSLPRFYHSNITLFGSVALSYPASCDMRHRADLAYFVWVYGWFKFLGWVFTLQLGHQLVVLFYQLLFSGFSVQKYFRNLPATLSEY